MKLTVHFLIALVFVPALISGCSATSPVPAGVVADLVFRNGMIYTVDSKHSKAEAVAIKDGKFLAVGSDKQIDKVVGSDTVVHDLGGVAGGCRHG